jgi:hypothetical protein
MTARYFGVNSLAGCFRTSTGVVESTTAGRFDSTYVANSIVVPDTVNYAQIKQPFLDGSTSLTGTFYLRFDLYPLNTSSVSALDMLNAGANAYRLLLVSGNTYQFQYWNSGSSAWVNWGSTFTMNTATLQTVVIALTPNVGYTLYLGGTNVANSAVVPTNGASAVDEFRLRSTSNSGGFWSQVMCADYDIRDAHLMPASFSGNSATNTGGTGAYTDINETVLDESTSEVVSTVGNKMGQTHSAVTVPAGLGVSALILNARGRVSGGTVTDGKLGVRSGSTNSSSTGRSFNGGYEPRGYIWTADPNGGGAWTQSSFNSAETYIEAA